MPHHRQLAAIMFTDIEGYTAAMQENESKAIELRERHRQVIKQAHENFSGRIVQYYGDGTLSIFQSAVTAVQCAIYLQQAFFQSPKVPVRIGLHIGDIIFEDEQVMGDGVNLASRIESLGMPGCVLLSDKVKDEINNHPALKTVSMGIYNLKNISRPVEVFALVHPELVTPKPGTLEGKTSPAQKTMPAVNKRASPKSVAVLPFANISNDPEQDYFSTGIAEEILNSLSNLKDLKVAGRTSTPQYNRENIDLREFGERLGVKTILEGSVRKQGNRIRIIVQLVNVSDGFHLWSQKYDRSMDDIFAIQDEVALAVTEKLKVTLLEKDKARITKTRTNNTEAYELYLKGRFHLNRRGGAILTGMHYFQLAVDLDPDFALAYTGLADAGIMAALYGLAPPKQVAVKAKEAAEKALLLDPHLSEPYCSLGAYYTFYEWNWREAENNFATCFQLNPGYAQAHYWYGLNYLAWVKHDMVEAEKHGRIATELEPMSAISFGMYGAILNSAGKYKEALAACTTGVELDSNHYLSQLCKGLTHLALRQLEEAEVIFSLLVRATKGHQFATNSLIVTYYFMGKIKEARELLNQLKAKPAEGFVGYALQALSVSLLDGVDEAFFYLEKAYEERDPILLNLKHNRLVPPKLKADPRFEQLFERVGFPLD